MSHAPPDFFNQSQQRITDALKGVVATEDATVSAALTDASLYSADNGGKRIRPILLQAAALAIGGESDDMRLDAPACAVELIHSYSLIHDDLPAMDDDDLRRGKPSLHRAFDEATAILVGDGLQAKAFELLACAPGLSAQQRVSMIEALSVAAGCAGMVGGQFIDIQSTDCTISITQLQNMHSLKTGALIKASLRIGGIAAAANDAQLQALDTFGDCIGLAFQVVDDILDVEGDTATLGKTSGKDTEANKPTYVKLLGLAGAKAEAQRLLESALDALESFGDSADALRDIARYIVQRDH
ncbi:MAG: polyprenyl synthetase family protein [Halieaceae bacterium]|nr:polyprenyl synthetase family protein [Halieaceae bacterium]